MEIEALVARAAGALAYVASVCDIVGLGGLEWTQFRLRTLGGSMTHEGVPWASSLVRWTDSGFIPGVQAGDRSAGPERAE
jgi:hypothetical protein